MCVICLFFFFYDLRCQLIWNIAERTGPMVTTLMEVQVPIINNTMCRENYKNHRNVIDDRVLCAGFEKGGKDSCRVCVCNGSKTVFFFHVFRMSGGCRPNTVETAF